MVHVAGVKMRVATRSRAVRTSITCVPVDGIACGAITLLLYVTIAILSDGSDGLTGAYVREGVVGRGVQGGGAPPPFARAAGKFLRFEATRSDFLDKISACSSNRKTQKKAIFVIFA